jgi:amyloid beta precursor protein binding protein 1
VTTLESTLATSPLFTAIMYALPIAKDSLALLEHYGRRNRTPLVAIHAAGFYSYFKISLPGAFPIVDTHPDETATTDLRLLKPWPELVEFARDMTKDIDSLDNYEHGHLPFVTILLHYLERWRETHGGANPTTYKEKIEFRNLVQKAARTNIPEGGEENFDEAAAAVLKTVVQPSLPSGLKEVFEHEPKEPVGPSAPGQQPSTCVIGADLSVHRLQRGPASGSSPRRSRVSMPSTAACHSAVASRT